MHYFFFFSVPCLLSLGKRNSASYTAIWASRAVCLIAASLFVTFSSDLVSWTQPDRHGALKKNLQSACAQLKATLLEGQIAGSELEAGGEPVPEHGKEARQVQAYNMILRRARLMRQAGWLWDKDWRYCKLYGFVKSGLFRASQTMKPQNSKDVNGKDSSIYSG